jgi:glycosidase
MWGGDDPDCRKPMVWPELKYEDETTHPFGFKRSADKVEFDSTLFNWYKKLISIRKNNNELSKGNLEFFIVDNENKLLGYKRTVEEKTSIVLINNNNRKKNIIFTTPYKALTNLITGEKYFSENKEFSVTLKQFEIAILK